MLVWLIFVATLCNVFIAAFGIEPIRKKKTVEGDGVKN